VWKRDLQEGGKLSKSVLRVYRRCCSCCREHGQVVSGEQLSVAGTESSFRGEAGVKTRLLALVAFTFFLLTAFRAGWTRAETDFPNYYTAAVLVRKGEPLRNYYDWTWFQRQMNYAGIERQLGAYTPQTPLTMLPMVGLTAFPPQRAKQIWLTLNLGFLLATVWLMSQVTRFRMEQIALLAFCGYHSLYVNFLYGQYYVFLLFLLTLAFYCVHREHSWSSGFFAGVAFGLKLYGGPFLLYFAAKRNWKAVAGMMAAIVCLVGVAIAVFGWTDIAYYATQILPRTLEGGSIDPYNPGVPTYSTLLQHLFMREPELNPHPLWNAPSLFFFLRPLLTWAIVVFTLLGLAMKRTTLERRDFAWFTVAVLLLSTSTGAYTFTLLLLPVVLSLEDARLAESILLIGCYVLLAFPLPAGRLFPKVWLLFLLFFTLGREYWGSLRPKLIVTVAVFIALIAFVDARRHLLSYANEPGQRFERIAVERGAIFSSSPAVSRYGVFYQSIGRDRYVLRWLHDNRIDELPFDGHAFHPVASAAEGPIYFELVAHGTSTIMQFDPSTGTVGPRSMPSSTGAADSAVSPDGKWIAYTSTLTGPKQVWLRNVATAKTQPLTGGNCNSSSPAWELNSKAILFASDCGRAIGLPALYRAQLPIGGGN
jgi:hypothetical protein